MAEQRVGDGGGGLLSADYFENLNFGRDTSTPDDHSGGGGESSHGLGVDEDFEISELYESSFGDDYLLSELTFENLDFGSGETIDNDLKKVDTNEVIRSSVGCAPRRIRLQLALQVDDSRFGLGRIEDSENQEFGRDTNRLDYFKVAAFDVHGDDHFTGAGTYGGGVGGGGTKDRGVVVELRTERERGSVAAISGGGIGTREVPSGIFANNGSEAVVQRVERETGNGGRDGGRRRRLLVVGSTTVGESGGIKIRRLPVRISSISVSNKVEATVQRLKTQRGSGGTRRRRLMVSSELERGSATAGAGGGGGRTREIPVGIFADNGSDSGEALIQKLKQKGVTLPIEVVVAVVVMMMVMVVLVLVSVMVMVKVRSL